MSGLKKMILLPEEMLEKFIGLSEKVESYSEGEGKGVSPDVFDSNTVDKTLDHLKTNLASILNSEKLDRSKVMEYKNDLLKLINMQGSRRVVVGGDVDASQTAMGENMSQELDEDVQMTTGDDTSAGDMTQSDSQFKSFLNGSQFNTPFRTLGSTTHSSTPKDADLKGEGRGDDGGGLLDPEQLMGEYPKTVEYARRIESYISSKAPNRIVSDSENRFKIDDKRIKGNLSDIIIDLASLKAKKNVKYSPGPRSGYRDLLSFLKDINLPESYIRNVRRLGDYKDIKDTTPKRGKQSKARRRDSELFFKNFNDRIK